MTIKHSFYNEMMIIIMGRKKPRECYVLLMACTIWHIAVKLIFHADKKGWINGLYSVYDIESVRYCPFINAWIYVCLKNFDHKVFLVNTILNNKSRIFLNVLYKISSVHFNFPLSLPFVLHRNGQGIGSMHRCIKITFACIF